MSFPSDVAYYVFRALAKCCQEVTPDGEWAWQCTKLNGARLSIAASLREGFLSLACGAEITADAPFMLNRAISANASLHKGVKIVLDPATRKLYLRSDITVLNELQLMARLPWVLDGFHHGAYTLANLQADCPPSPEVTDAASPEHHDQFQECMRDSSWRLTKRGSDEFAVELESDSAPPALICIDKGGIAASVEMVRCGRSDGAVRDALAIYLLTATRETCLVRAAKHSGDREIFALQATLPAWPSSEEMDHTLAALSVAHRACVREANVLLNEAAARYYLTARGPAITSQPNQ